MRFLRPGQVVSAGDSVWVIDELQPVAALLDAATGAVRRLVSWPDLPPPPPDGTWRVAATGPDLWVQPAEGGALARVEPTGRVHGGYSAGRWLAVAEPRGAWCINRYRPQIFLSAPDQEPPPLSGDVVVVVDPAGEVRRVDVDRPVRAVYVDQTAQVWLAVDDTPPTTRDIGISTWELRWRTAWLRVPPGPLPARLSVADAVAGEPVWPPNRTAGLQYWLSSREHPVHAGRRRWSGGWAAGGSRFDRPLVLTGHHPDDEEPLRIDLGAGQILTMLGTATGLWLTVRRRRGPAAPAELLRVDPATGAVATVSTGADIDIGALGWPPVRPPVEAGSFVHYQRDRFSRGAPTAENTGRWSAEPAGSWPHTELLLSFDHADYPGVRLRRRVPLFDAIGRPVPPEFADVHLTEDIATGALPPPGAAVDGVLEV